MVKNKKKTTKNNSPYRALYNSSTGILTTLGRKLNLLPEVLLVLATALHSSNACPLLLVRLS